jgi:hypothetical protein
MTYGRIINGQKYICLHNKNEFKKLSFEDNMYFTLRDIFLNTNTNKWTDKMNALNKRLIEGIFYEDRQNNFAYAIVLDDTFNESLIMSNTNPNTNPNTCLNNLACFFDQFNESSFDFEQINDNKIETKTDTYMHNYILFEDWWKQFTELKNEIKN